jgi:glycerol-3-phosphate acyltransferase PlsX
MRIVVDVMGGDHGPEVVIEGAKRALQTCPKITELHLVGRADEIHAGLSRAGLQDPRVHVFHSSEVLTMEDKPIEGLRKKKDCSILRAVDLLREEKGDALISPGNTGGLVAAATIRLRTLPGVDRAGIATVIPGPKSDFVLLDSGANVESRPKHLAHYAVMGTVYSHEILGCKNPRVGLLCNGTEETKGTELTQKAFALCRELDIRFVGNVEGHDLFHDRVDVVICDGFVGNIVLKTLEGFAKGLLGWMQAELNKNPKRKLGALLAINAFRAIKRRIDPDAYGGAPLLGVNGNVMKAHGSASACAIMNAIRFSADAVHHQINQVMREQVARANERLSKLRVSEAVPTAA